MKTILNLFTQLIAFVNIIFPQNYFYDKTLFQFSDASSFSITSSGNIYITDIGQNEIIMIDTLGNEIKTIGGYGWNESQFDEPSDIFANNLNVYITDKNNNRIQFFDKDLNFITQLKGYNNTEIQFNYPVCAEVSNLGDLFILDYDNKRIIKSDINGKFLLEFGNYKSGTFSLRSPIKMTISDRNQIFVIDDEQLLIFDYFGTGISKIALKLSFINLNINLNQLYLNTKKSVYILDMSNNSFNKILFNKELNDLIEVKSAFGYLFILTSKELLKFKDDSDK